MHHQDLVNLLVDLRPHLVSNLLLLQLLSLLHRHYRLRIRVLKLMRDYRGLLLLLILGPLVLLLARNLIQRLVRGEIVLSEATTVGDVEHLLVVLNLLVKFHPVHLL